MTEKKTYKNFQGGLKIVKEYAEVLPPLKYEEFAKLKACIEKDGRISDPLTVTEDGVILDGHSRYKIAEMLDMGFETYVKKVNSIEDGIVWIIDNQLGRRQ